MKKQQHTRVRLNKIRRRQLILNLFQQPPTYQEHLFMQTLKIWMT